MNKPDLTSPKINPWLFSLITIVAIIPSGYIIYTSWGFPINIPSIIVVTLALALSIWISYLLSQKTRNIPNKIKNTYDQLYEVKQNLENQTVILVRNALSINEYRNKLEDRNSELVNTKTDLEKQNIILTQNTEKLKKYQIELEARNQQLQATLEQTQKLSESLASEKQQMEILLQSLTDGVMAVDHQNRIILFNKAAQAITNTPKEQFLNRPIDEKLHLYNKNGKIIPLAEYTEQSEATVNEMWNTGLIYKSGENKVYLAIAASPVKFPGQEKNGWIITFHDKTKEHELEAMKLDFVSMAAHELRTPLTTIKGYISMLQQPESLQKLNDMETDILNRAASSAMRLSKLIENLLIVSKIEQEKVSLTFQKIQITKLAEKAVKEYEILANNKHIKLTYIPPSQPLPETYGDTSRLGEVFSNLIGNAINYTEKGEIKVAVQQKSNQIIVSVKDTGKGIPQEAVSHLFSKFFRVKNNLVEKQVKGTGLGLYITKNIITGHNGKIWVESELGKGSTFYFSLPITDQAPVQPNVPVTTNQNQPIKPENLIVH